MRAHPNGECWALAEVVHVTKQIGRHKVVDNLSLTLRPGDVLGIVGPNGAGKSTLLKMVAGVIPPTVGYARIQGLDVQERAGQVRQLLGYMSQGVHGYNDMTVIGFLKFVARIRGVYGARLRSRIDEVVGRLQLEQMLYRPLNSLSKSNNRLVGMAQAVLHEPAVLILDEPGDELDANQRYLVHALIKGYSSDKAIILTTRSLEEVTALCSRTLIVANGQLRAEGTPWELQSLSRYHQAVCLSAEQPLDLLALALLPGVAGIESDRRTPGAITVLAKPDCVIFPSVHALIIGRQWQIRTLSVESGCLDDVYRRLTGPFPA